MLRFGLWTLSSDVRARVPERLCALWAWWCVRHSYPEKYTCGSCLVCLYVCVPKWRTAEPVARARERRRVVAVRRTVPGLLVWVMMLMCVLPPISPFPLLTPIIYFKIKTVTRSCGKYPCQTIPFEKRKIRETLENTMLSPRAWCVSVRATSNPNGSNLQQYFNTLNMINENVHGNGFPFVPAIPCTSARVTRHQINVSRPLTVGLVWCDCVCFAGVVWCSRFIAHTHTGSSACWVGGVRRA